MDTVSFTRMDEGTYADYELIARCEDEYNQRLPDRLLEAVGKLESSIAGFQITRLEHSLQSATRAHRDGREEEYVVAALIHDVGDELAPYTHGEMVAALMRPFLPERLCWIVQHHGAFQQFYYGEKSGADPHARERWRGHQWFDDCVEFCERYDQNCFGPYDNLPLEFFEPLVRRVFSEPRYLEQR
jgi:predicted HD phosphohydrolase